MDVGNTHMASVLLGGLWTVGIVDSRTSRGRAVFTSE